MDYIHLQEMEFYGYHGVLQEETKLGQRFRVSVSLAIDLTTAGTTDQLIHTVNYAEVYEICQDIVEGHPYQLIEAVAETIAQRLLTTYHQKVKGVRVKFIKPDPPIPGHYAHVAVELTRGQFH